MISINFQSPKPWLGSAKFETVKIKDLGYIVIVISFNPIYKIIPGIYNIQMNSLKNK
jgi:hypothetical protein